MSEVTMDQLRFEADKAIIQELLEATERIDPNAALIDQQAAVYSCTYRAVWANMAIRRMLSELSDLRKEG